ncbi:MAG: twin-arginine translocase subunit TatC [Acidobacteria bacterium]|nr:twin-arginine translocase subunit TatC [Acidobacteriota bacterium]MDA1236199.1 twin-arginine translocase subunit TatC [Acidobacteriota bacterium]
MSSDGKEPRDPESGEHTTDLDQDRQQPEGAVVRGDSAPPAPVDDEPGSDYEYEYEDDQIDEAEKASAEPEAAVEAAPLAPAGSDYEYEYQDDEIDEADKTSAEAAPDTTTALAKSETEAGAAPGKTLPPSPPPPLPPAEDEDDDEEMARMSFLEHLNELRTRIVRVLIGVVVIYLAALAFADKLFLIFKGPFEASYPGVQLSQLTPTEMFYIQYIKLPLLAAVFLGAPWIMLQVWGFISPGLYKRERRLAAPFIFTTALLFVSGGLFCYYVALPLALGFLLGLSADAGVQQVISLTSYYDMFFNLEVGMGVVFQMPVVIFFFTLLRITSPAFLMRNGRYAILIIFIAAAIITPTPDVTTMLTFAAPMILLYYAGIAASYMIVLRRENRKFPWGTVILVLVSLLIVAALIGAYMVVELNYQLVPYWPFVVPPG